MDNGGSEILSYKVRFEDQAGNLTSVTVSAENIWGLQELLVRRQLLRTDGSLFKCSIFLCIGRSLRIDGDYGQKNVIRRRRCPPVTANTLWGVKFVALLPQ